MNFQFTYSIGGNTISDVMMSYRVNYSTKTVKLTCKMSDISTYSIGNGDAVLIQYGIDDGTGLGYCFRGTVENVQVNGDYAVLTCNDKMLQLANRTINNVYDVSDAFAGAVDEIFIDMVTTYGGLTADATTVQDTGALNIRDQLWCFDVDVRTKAMELLRTVLYLMYYDDSDNKVHAHLKGYRSYDGFITSVNIVGTPVWSDNTVNLFNYLKLKGATRTSNYEEFFTGDGSTTDFTLSFVPDNKQNVKVEVHDGADWVLQDFGVEGVTESYDYTINDSPAVKEINFVAASAPPAAADNVRVNYTYNEILYTESVDAQSKNDYPAADGGYRYASLCNPDIKTMADLERMAEALMNIFTKPFITCSFSTGSLNTIPMIGMSTTVNDTVNNKNRRMIIKEFSFSTNSPNFNFSVEDMYGNPNDLLFTSNERLRKLEEASRGNATFITDSRSLDVQVEAQMLSSATSFNGMVDTWTTTSDWSTSDTWGISNNSDDFKVDLTAQKWAENVGTWSVSNGFYYQSNAGVTAYNLWKYASYLTYQDPEINIKVKPVSDETVGVLFRFDGTDGYCIRYKDASNVELGTYNTTTGFSQLEETSYARALGVWTFWRILVKGDRIIFLAGDSEYGLELIFDTVDDTYSNSGSAGLITFSASAYFGNFKVGEVKDLYCNISI